MCRQQQQHVQYHVARVMSRGTSSITWLHAYIPNSTPRVVPRDTKSPVPAFLVLSYFYPVAVLFQSKFKILFVETCC